MISCGECTFWVSMEDEAYKGKFGECRLNSPVAPPFLSAGTIPSAREGNLSLRAVWPATEASDGCFDGCKTDADVAGPVLPCTAFPDGWSLSWNPEAPLSLRFSFHPHLAPNEAYSPLKRNACGPTAEEAIQWAIDWRKEHSES